MSEWRENKLKNVLEVKYGKDHKKLGNGNIPVYGSGGIMRWANQSIYNDESILIPRKGTLSNIMYVNKPFWTVDTMFYTKLNRKFVVPKYLFYQLTEIDFTNLNVGSAVPSMTVEILNDIDILLPPLQEQERIAEVFSSLDDKIDLLNRQNKTLEQMAETLFRQWLGKLDDSETAILGDYIKVQNGYAFKSNDFKDTGNNGILKITNISFEKVDIYNIQFVDDEVVAGLSEKFLAKSKSFLIAMTGAEIGKIGIIGKTSKKLYINQRVGMLVDKLEYSSLLGYLFLKSAEGQDHIINTCTGSAQENISSVGIEAMIIPKSTPEEIVSFCNSVNPLFEKIICNLGQIQQLETLRDTLLPKLMSGVVKVKN